MSPRKTPFVVGEWYHCYSRGIDKRDTFLEEKDYKRFLEVMYLTNQPKRITRADFTELKKNPLWGKPSSTLVVVGAYCLMPNHFHLLLKEIVSDGISMFMQKLGTAYTMYFNTKYERSGGLFTRPFRSKHVQDDRYLRWIIQYIHLNPTELLKQENDGVPDFNTEATPLLLETYPYSSLRDYRGIIRPERAILDEKEMEFLS